MSDITLRCVAARAVCSTCLDLDALTQGRDLLCVNSKNYVPTLDYPDGCLQHWQGTGQFYRRHVTKAEDDRAGPAAGSRWLGAFISGYTWLVLRMNGFLFDWNGNCWLIQPTDRLKQSKKREFGPEKLTSRVKNRRKNVKPLITSTDFVEVMSGFRLASSRTTASWLYCKAAKSNSRQAAVSLL